MQYVRINRSTALITVLCFGSCTLSCDKASEGDGVHQSRLENGLSVLLYPSSATDKVALVMLFDIGEDHDPPDKSGLAHLVEHLYITAAAGETPARTVNEIMRRYPNSWNAQTGTDYTVFATVFPKQALQAELREARDRISDLRITEADLARELPRLLQEIHNMFEGIPALAAINHARSRVRPSAVGHRKGGLPNHLRRLSIKDAHRWWSKYYKPSNATLVLAGAFEPKDAQMHIEKYFGTIPSGDRHGHLNKIGSVKPAKIDAIRVGSNTPALTRYGCIAFAAPQPGSEHYAASLVIINRMWMAAAGAGAKPQVVFNVLDDPSLIAVSGPLHNGEANETAIRRLRGFVDSAIRAEFQPLEARTTRNNFGFMLGLNDCSDAMIKQNLYGVAFSLGRRAQLGLDSAILLKNLETLTGQDLAAAADDVFGADRQVAVVVRPTPTD